MLAAKLLFIDSYYFLLVQLLNDLYQQSLFVCSCSKRAQGSAIKHQQGINIYYIYIYIYTGTSIIAKNKDDLYQIYPHFIQKLTT